MPITSDEELVRQEILEHIDASDENRASGTHYQSESYLGHVGFHDFMDILLFSISLRPDRDYLTRVRSNDFWTLVRDLWDEHREHIEQAWGGRSEYLRLWSAWQGGPGPLGGTASAASTYARGRTGPGFLQFEYLSSWFQFVNPEPGSRSMVGNLTGWQEYERQFDGYVLPRFKREEHRAKLEVIFDFADALCLRMRDV